MRNFLCIALLLTLALPTGVSAGGLSGGVASDCEKKAPSERKAGTERFLKGFVDPATGEVLTYEQAREMGIVDGEGAASLSGSARASTGVAEEPSEIRRVPLEGGGYAIEIKPSFRKELRARISEDGRTEFQCH